MSNEVQFADRQRSVREWWDRMGKDPEVLLHRAGHILSDRDSCVLAREWLAVDEGLYQHSANALGAWAAILDAHTGGVALPLWVGEYLGRAACELFDLARDSSVRREQRSARIAEILGLKPHGAGRKRDAFDRWKDPTPGMTLAHKLWMATAKLTHERARELVAEAHGVSESVVDRAWRKWKDSVVPRDVYGRPLRRHRGR